MDNRRKLQAVKARLGEPKQTAPRKNEYGFLCPNPKCTSAKQGKVRLWVNPEKDTFNCWHCGFSGKSLAAIMVQGSKEHREYLESKPAAKKSVFARPVEVQKPRCVSLPAGFTPIRLSGEAREAPYVTYLRRRGVSDDTIGLYRMGYVDFGPLSGRVVVPSFDALGMPNFWSARSIYPTEKTFSYRLPDASKDVVSNEHLVNWTEPVYLVEGIFDEVAIGPQAISLYGKFLQPLLAKRLVEHRPPVVYVCLDSDARKEALELMEQLVGYDITCALVDLPGKDPAELGLDVVQRVAEESRKVTGSAGLVTVEGRL
jgi:hypothetical protein